MMLRVGSLTEMCPRASLILRNQTFVRRCLAQDAPEHRDTKVASEVATPTERMPAEARGNVVATCAMRRIFSHSHV